MSLQRLGGTRVAIFCLPGHIPIHHLMSKAKRERHSPLSINTAAFGRVFVMPVAGLVLCYGESNNLTWPQLGPRLFFISGEAVTSRSRSSPILMGWSFVQCNGFKKC